MNDHRVAAALPHGQGDHLAARIQCAAVQPQLGDVRQDVERALHLLVGEDVVLVVLRIRVLAQKFLHGGQILRLAGAKYVIGVRLFKFMDVVALAAVAAARIIAEGGSVIQ